jgi:beta-lactam-binding protein with PASTA domain
VVPNVIHNTLGRAKSRIRHGNCRVGQVTRKFSSRRLKGHVIRQAPRGGRHLANGARVNLVVGTGRRH